MTMNQGPHGEKHYNPTQVGIEVHLGGEPSGFETLLDRSPREEVDRCRNRQHRPWGERGREKSQTVGVGSPPVAAFHEQITPANRGDGSVGSFSWCWWAVGRQHETAEHHDVGSGWKIKDSGGGSFGSYR